MAIQLSNHFTFKKLLRFTLPSIAMMIFTSVYSVVDGFFVSNFAGKTPFTAINLIWPYIMLLGTLGFMIGTGGSALIGKFMGEGDCKKANELFSMFIYSTAVLGTVIAIIGIITLRKVAVALGAEGELIESCMIYGRTLFISLPAYMLQFEFHTFFVTAEQPKLGLIVTVSAGLTNIALDAILVAGLSMGLAGAAAATAVSQYVGGLAPLIYFARDNGGTLRLGKTHFDGRAFLKACSNGASELMSNISISLVSMLYNYQLLRYSGEDGVAAYGVLMYVNMIFLSVFFGYSTGSAPIVSFHYGAKNTSELKNLLKKSLIIISCSAVFMFIAAGILARPLSLIFVGYDEELLNLTVQGFLIFAFSFLFAGFPIYGSSFFTALNNGIVSAIISAMRTLVFQTAAVLLLPLIFGTTGIWLSIVTAEFLAALSAAFWLVVMRKRYLY